LKFFFAQTQTDRQTDRQTHGHTHMLLCFETKATQMRLRS